MPKKTSKKVPPITAIQGACVFSCVDNRFDEIVIDSWLHIEAMDENEVSVRLGTLLFSVYRNSNGHVVVCSVGVK